MNKGHAATKQKPAAVRPGSRAPAAKARKAAKKERRRGY